MKTRTLTLLLAGLLGLLLVAAICRLYVLRFEVGDVYPAYSSLRADPLGTKALYASLESLPGFEVARAFREIEPDAATPRTVLVLGTNAQGRVTARDFDQVKTLAASGDRVVIAFAPVREAPGSRKKKADASPSSSPSPAEEVEETQPMGEGMRDRLGCDFAYLEPGKLEDLEARTVAPDLEDYVPWHSLLVFQPTRPDWRTLYQADGKPVALERDHGRGSIVLLADAYLLSNEALREHRSPRFLAWLIGESRVVLFDETVHGLYENPGIVGLMRKYQLEPVLLFAVLLAALFAWQNLSPLIPLPAPADARLDSEVAGRDAIAGRINLLRRSVPPSTLMARCLELWEKSAGRRLAHRPQLLDKIRTQAAAKAPPAQVYGTIAETLAQDRHPSVNPVNPVNPV